MGSYSSNFSIDEVGLNLVLTVLFYHYQSAPCAPPMHIHLEQAEHFTVLEGEMGAVMDGKEVFLKPGDGEYVSSAGQAHTFWPVVDAGDLHVKVKATPGDVQGRVSSSTVLSTGCLDFSRGGRTMLGG